MLKNNEIPDSRSSGLLLNIFSNNFLLIGGGSREKAFEDIWQLKSNVMHTANDEPKSIVSNKLFSWKKISAQNNNENSFTERFGHCGVVIRNDKEDYVQIYIHGGQNHFKSAFYLDFFLIKIRKDEDITKNNLTATDKTSHFNNLQFIEFKNLIKYPVDIYNTPCERNSHTMCFDNTNKQFIYIFGGGNNLGLLNDLWAYDLKKEKFNLVALEANIIPAREMHGLIEYKDHLYILGGRLYDSIDNKIYKINLTTLKIDSDFTKLPTALCSFAYCLYKNYVIIYGGTDGVSFLNSITIYNLNNNKWAKSKLSFDIKGQEVKLDGKIGSHMSIDEENDSLIIFGGSSIHEDSNETQIFSLSALLNENNLIKITFE